MGWRRRPPVHRRPPAGALDEARSLLARPLRDRRRRRIDHAARPRRCSGCPSILASPEWSAVDTVDPVRAWSATLVEERDIFRGRPTTCPPTWRCASRCCAGATATTPRIAAPFIASARPGGRPRPPGPDPSRPRRRRSRSLRRRAAAGLPGSGRCPSPPRSVPAAVGRRSVAARRRSPRRRRLPRGRRPRRPPRPGPNPTRCCCRRRRRDRRRFGPDIVEQRTVAWDADRDDLVETVERRLGAINSGDRSGVRGVATRPRPH